ncbi:hypothetical protein MFIFM68171_06665 [Madurella fahalii]|uniref:Uncharacterized protein n=1 Tax=Madurella fahalii TaxID=1157608 RepID=A0ABQ0GFX3_9PEZI
MGAVIAPTLITLLEKNCPYDFTIQVHTSPAVSSKAVRRFIYITLHAEDKDIADSAGLEQTIQTELVRVVPSRFSPLHLKFY